MARKSPNPIPAEAAERLLADLEPVGNIAKKAMFGGYGLFTETAMFALIDTTGASYFRADDTTSIRYESAGSTRHGAMPYWQIPEPVRNNEVELLTWACEAIEVAASAKRR